MTNQTRVIVATNAFGLGIDKEDVKLVVHMQLPLNIESYFQEAGRAGRNGKTAYSFLLINQSDVKRNKDILNFRYPMLEEIQEMYQKIADYLQVAVNTLPVLLKNTTSISLKHFTPFNFLKTKI